jgi:hypothetical protein
VETDSKWTVNDKNRIQNGAEIGSTSVSSAVTSKK